MWRQAENISHTTKPGIKKALHQEGFFRALERNLETAAYTDTINKGINISINFCAIGAKYIFETGCRINVQIFDIHIDKPILIDGNIHPGLCSPTPGAVQFDLIAWTAK